MIDFIEGEIVTKELQRLVLRTGGVGFSLKISGQTLSQLPPRGSHVLVYTYLQMREDDINLFGFYNEEERMFFELLLQVSGIGPKLALAALSTYSVPVLKKALIMGDLAVLTNISGIGKKTAQRMILELKDKLSKEVFADEGNRLGITAGEWGGLGGNDAAQAAEALEALGYARPEIIKCFAGKDLSGMDVEGMIKLGLKSLAKF